jgi:hypothetical protein
VSCPAQPADGYLGGCHARRHAPCHGVPRQVPRRCHAPCHGGVPRAMAPAASCISRPQPPAGAATGCHASPRCSCSAWPRRRFQVRVRLRVGCATTSRNDLASSYFQVPAGTEFITQVQRVFGAGLIPGATEPAAGLNPHSCRCAHPFRSRLSRHSPRPRTNGPGQHGPKYPGQRVPPRDSQSSDSQQATASRRRPTENGHPENDLDPVW